MWNPFAKHLNKLEQMEGGHRISDAGRRAGTAPQAARSAPARERVHDSPSDGGHFHEHTSIAEIELVGQVAVATLTVDELSQSSGVEGLAALLQELKETGAKHYVLDIQNIQYMDSMCLGCLVESLNNMATSGGKIALASCDQNVQQLFRMTRLDRVFPICRDVLSAMTAVERERA